MSITIRFFESLKANNYRLFFLLVFLLASTSLGIAYFVEFALGFKPCILCLYERIPFFFLIIFSCFGMIRVRYTRGSIILIKITFLLAACLTFYHVGIEHNIFHPTSTCEVEKGFGQGLSVSEMLDKINKSPLSDCRKPEIKLFGFSMAEANLALNILMFFFTIMVCRFTSRHSRA